MFPIFLLPSSFSWASLLICQYLCIYLTQPVEDEILLNLRWILKRRQSVDEVHSEKSQWIGPSLFSYKAEVDFDGTWLAVQVRHSTSQQLISYR